MRVLKIGAAMAALVVISAGPAAAQISYQIDAVSRYIWRGFDMFKPNAGALQPSLIYAFGGSGFSANIWTSFSLAGQPIDESRDEIDLTLAYAFKTPEEYGLSVGLIHYGWYFDRPFTFKNNTTQEFFVTAGLPKAFLQPSLSVYYDVNRGSGLYASLKVKQSLPLGETVALNLSAGLGYNSRQWIDTSGWSDLTIGATLPIKIGASTIAPLVSYAFVFLKEVNLHNEFWFGLSWIY